MFLYHDEGIRTTCARSAGKKWAATCNDIRRVLRTQREPVVRCHVLRDGEPLEAEEITQDAFLKVWERWERVSTLESAEAYLFKVAMNLFRNRLRRAALAARKALALAPEER